MSVARETLPLSIGELQRTREPLERATALPQAAFTDPRVLDWELEHVFMGGWIWRRARRPGARARRLRHGRARPREHLRRGRRRRRAARLPEHLPPPRRAHRPGRRGPPPARAMPLPRLVLRLRRLAAKRAPHRRDRGLRPALLQPARRPRGGRRGHRPDRPVGHGPGARRARRRHGADAGALPPRRPAPRPADRLRGRGQLEGDRRELQRVPALPGRPSRAQPAQPLPVGRDAHGRGRLVRRLDDAARRRPDDGESGATRQRARRSRASTRTTSARSSTTCSSPTRSSRCIPTT